ncbi:MAG: GxxExxY protein [Longimicrobiales bacterium]
MTVPAIPITIPARQHLLVIGEAISVHRELGPGLLESTYEACLTHALASGGLRVERQVATPVVFRGKRLECGYRIDMLVEGAVVVEIKTVRRIERVHVSQVRTYLKLSGRHVGLLINFDVDVLTAGIKRVVYGYRGEKPSGSGVRPATLGNPE